MSFILEALNKAENERSGEGTQSTAATYSMSVADNNWWRTPSFILLAIGIAAFALYLSRPFFTHPPEVVLAITDQSTDIQIEPQQQVIGQPSTAYTPESIASTVDTTAKEKPASPNNSINNNDAMRLKDIAPAPGANHISAKAETKTIDRVSQAITVTTRQLAQQNSQPQIKPKITANLGANTSKIEGEAPHEDQHLEAPLFQNLPSDIKAQLPDMELNIHVYSTNPSKSFVYINSRRYQEGATIGNSITLEKVTPTGVILRHQGSAFRLVIET